MQELVDEWQKSVRMLATECSILAILQDRAMSRIELKNEFNDRSKGIVMFLGVDPCRSLRSMEQRGLVSTGSKNGKTELGAAKCYHITKKGESWLKDLVSDCHAHRGQEQNMQ